MMCNTCGVEMEKGGVSTGSSVGDKLTLNATNSCHIVGSNLCPKAYYYFI